VGEAEEEEVEEWEAGNKGEEKFGEEEEVQFGQGTAGWFEVKIVEEAQSGE
jgi:hypothetical protein